MDAKPKFTFVPLEERNNIGINSRKTQEFLEKWGIKDNLVFQYFSFNEDFQQYHKYHLAEAFFKDSIVAKELLTKQGNVWAKQGTIATSVEVKQIPCTTLSMDFFDKLKNPKNNIVYGSGTICKRFDNEIDGFLVSDNLRGMLLDEECPEFNLYSGNEREEFIFRIFQLVVLGGILCQYEDTIDPYFEVTKLIYKDLIRVQMQKYSESLGVSTLVLEVVAKDHQNQAYFPYDPSNKQNVGFLLIDGNSREITTVLHQFRTY